MTSSLPTRSKSTFSPGEMTVRTFMQHALTESVSIAELLNLPGALLHAVYQGRAGRHPVSPRLPPAQKPQRLRQQTPTPSAYPAWGSFLWRCCGSWPLGHSTDAFERLVLVSSMVETQRWLPYKSALPSCLDVVNFANTSAPGEPRGRFAGL